MNKLQFNNITKEITDLFFISSSSKSFLKWKKNNKDAGTIDNDGYYIVIVKSKRYRVHRIIVKLTYPDVDLTDFEVDHLNGIRHDNNPLNLRAVNKSTNRRNSGVRSDNKTGTVGVSLTNNSVNGKYYTASAKIHGRTVKKHFSINKLGHEQALKLAISARMLMIEQLILEGEPYTDRHIGKDGVSSV